MIERFDRLFARDGRLIRLPQEDCCQALSVLPTRKYQNEGGPGIVEICELLQGSDEPARDRASFFKANVLFWLIGATDGHAKNFSIALMPGGRFTMTPFYDVLSVQPMLDAGQLRIKDMKLAMRVGRNRRYRVVDILGRHFAETGLAASFSREQIAQVSSTIRPGALRCRPSIPAALNDMRGLRYCAQGDAARFFEIHSDADRAFETALSEMPPGFPMALIEAVKRGFQQRIGRLVPTT